MLVVRARGAQSLDPDNTSGFLSAFAKNVARLLLKGDCFDHGYTAIMLGHLSEVHVRLFSGKEPMSMGGNVTDKMRARCLKRMQCWVRLALEVCQAEWPQFETVQAFSIFRPEANESGAHAAQNPIAMKHEHLSRLARFAGVDVVELTKHVDVHVPLALHIRKSSNIAACFL